MEEPPVDPRLCQIPYTSPKESLTTEQLNLVQNHRDKIQYHTSWFITLAEQGATDLVGLYENISANRLACSALHCPPRCGKTLNQIDLINLLSPDIKITPEERELILRQINFETIALMVPYILYNGNNSQIVTYLGNNGDMKAQLLKEPRLLLELYLATIDTDTLKECNECVSTIINSVDWPEDSFFSDLAGISRGFKIAQLMISKNGTTITKQCQYTLDKLVGTFFTNYRLANIRLLKYGGPESDVPTMLELTIMTVLRSAQSQFRQNHICNQLIITHNAYSAYIISYLLRISSKFCKFKIPTPKVILFSQTTALLELPVGTAWEFDPREMYPLFEQVEVFSGFVVTCYLFGLKHKYIMICDDGLFTLQYGELYMGKKIRLGNIINTLGGRNSVLYKSFLAHCVARYLLLRKCYRQACLLLGLLGVKPVQIMDRFQPLMSDSDAAEDFSNKLAEYGKLAVGNQKWFGQ